MGSNDPGIGGSAAGKLPFGKNMPVQPSETDAATIVLFALVKPTIRSNAEKSMLESELTVTTSEMGPDEVYVVPPSVRLAVPEPEEY
jgi:hypothetical protein